MKTVNFITYNSTVQNKHGPFEFSLPDKPRFIESFFYDCPEQNCVIVEYVFLNVPCESQIVRHLLLNRCIGPNNYSICADSKFDTLDWKRTSPSSFSIPKKFRSESNFDLIYRTYQHLRDPCILISHEWKHDLTLKLGDENNVKIVNKKTKKYWSVPLCTWQTPQQLYSSPICAEDGSLILLIWKDHNERRLQILHCDDHTSYSFLIPHHPNGYFFPVPGTLSRQSPWLVFHGSIGDNHSLYIRRKRDGKYMGTVPVSFVSDAVVLPGGVILMTFYNKQKGQVKSVLFDRLWYPDYLLLCWQRMRIMKLFDGHMLFLIKSYLFYSSKK